MSREKNNSEDKKNKINFKILTAEDLIGEKDVESKEIASKKFEEIKPEILPKTTEISTEEILPQKERIGEIQIKTTEKTSGVVSPEKLSKETFQEISPAITLEKEQIQEPLEMKTPEYQIPEEYKVPQETFYEPGQPTSPYIERTALESEIFYRPQKGIDITEEVSEPPQINLLKFKNYFLVAIPLFAFLFLIIFFKPHQKLQSFFTSRRIEKNQKQEPTIIFPQMSTDSQLTLATPTPTVTSTVTTSTVTPIFALGQTTLTPTTVPTTSTLPPSKIVPTVSPTPTISHIPTSTPTTTQLPTPTRTALISFPTQTLPLPSIPTLTTPTGPTTRPTITPSLISTPTPPKATQTVPQPSTPTKPILTFPSTPTRPTLPKITSTSTVTQTATPATKIITPTPTKQVPTITPATTSTITPTITTPTKIVQQPPLPTPSQPTSVYPQPQKEFNFLFFFIKEEISVKSLTQDDFNIALNNFLRKQEEFGTKKVVNFIYNNQKITYNFLFDHFFKSSKVNFEELKRNFNGDYALIIYYGYVRKYPIIVFGVNESQKVKKFNENWEKLSMANDLKSLFLGLDPGKIDKSFTTKNYGNYSYRILDLGNNYKIIWAIVDKYLIYSTTETGLKEIIDNL
jgi:hypothetical protein